MNFFASMEYIVCNERKENGTIGGASCQAAGVVGMMLIQALSRVVDSPAARNLPAIYKLVFVKRNASVSRDLTHAHHC